MIKNHRYQSKTVVPGSSISPRRDEFLFVGQDIVKSQIAIRRAYGAAFLAWHLPNRKFFYGVAGWVGRYVLADSVKKCFDLK
jgi:hypothetical protein